jgi:hypothetical protein
MQYNIFINLFFINKVRYQDNDNGLLATIKKAPP